MNESRVEAKTRGLSVLALVAVQFSWDPRKGAANLRKHGVSFEEAATVFADPVAMAVSDAIHPERDILIGQSEQQPILLAVYAELDEDTIRITSARRRDRAREEKL